MATTTDAAAKSLVLAVLEDLFGPSGRPFAQAGVGGWLRFIHSSVKERLTFATPPTPSSPTDP